MKRVLLIASLLLVASCRTSGKSDVSLDQSSTVDSGSRDAARRDAAHLDATSPGQDDEYTQAYWKMDEVVTSPGVITDGGTRAELRLVIDHEARPYRHHDLALRGTATLKPGLQGQALSLDGEQGWAQSLLAWRSQPAGIRIEGWLLAEAVSWPRATVAASDVWRLQVEPEKKVLTFWATDGRKQTASVSVSLELGVWQHFVASFEHGTLELRVGEASAQAQASTTLLKTGTAAISLGRWSDQSPELFRGLLDEVKLSSQPVATPAARGADLLATLYLQLDPKSSCDVAGGCTRVNANAPTEVVMWSAVVLWLGPDAKLGITADDVSLANQRLQALIDGKQFLQIPQTACLIDSPMIYWALPLVVRILSSSRMTGRTTLEARQALRYLLERFVAQRDRVVDAKLPDALWQIKGSMNHDWLMKSVFLLTAQHFRKLAEGAGRNNYADGQTAAQHYEAWKVYLKEKIKQVATRGLDAEIASPTYLQITLEALFNLRDLAEDPVLAALAERLIDLILADGALDSFHGVRGGGKTRCYKDESAYHPDSDSLGYWSHLFANDPVTLSAGMQRPLLGAATSSYVLKPQLLHLLTRPDARPADGEAHESSRLGHGTPPAANFSSVEQCSTCKSCEVRDCAGGIIYGLDLPNGLRRYSWSTPLFVMGGFTDNEQDDCYIQLHTQNQWMGLVGGGWRWSRLYFQAGPPEAPGAEQGATHRDLQSIAARAAMLIKRNALAKPSKGVLPPLSAYLSPDLARHRVGPDASTQGWLFAQDWNGSFYVALKVAGVNDGAGCIVEDKPELCPGITTGCSALGNPAVITFKDLAAVVALQAAPATAFSSFAVFQEQVRALSLQREASAVRFVSLAGNVLRLSTGSTPALPQLDGQPFSLELGATYRGPWLTNEGFGEPVVLVRDPVDNSVLRLDFNY